MDQLKSLIKVYLLEVLVVLLAIFSTISIYLSGYGTWMIQFAGSAITRYSDPAGAYLESGAHLVFNPTYSFPGHPGLFSKIVVLFTSLGNWILSGTSYISGFIENYMHIAMFSNWLHAVIFLLYSYYSINQILDSKHLKIIFYLLLFSLPYFISFFLTTAPENFAFLGVMMLIWGWRKDQDIPLIVGTVLILFSKYMFLIPLLPFYLLFKPQTQLKIAGVTVVCLILYFSFFSLAAFQDFWFRFSPLGVVSEGRKISNNPLADIRDSLLVLPSIMERAFNLNLIYRDTYQFPHQINWAFIFLLSAGLSSIYFTKIIKNRFVFSAILTLSIILILFRNENHYVLSSMIFFVLITFIYLENYKIAMPKYLLYFIVLLFATNLVHWYNFTGYNIQKNKKYTRFFNASPKQQKAIIDGSKKRLLDYYQFQFGYSTLQQELPIYKELKKRYEIKN